MKTKYNTYERTILIIKISIAGLLLFMATFSSAIAQVTTLSSGKFSDPQIWSSNAMPTMNDQVIIQTGHIIEMDTTALIDYLTVQDNGKLIIGSLSNISISNGLTINGKLEIIEGDINLIKPGGTFKLGQNGYLTWAPGNNTSAGASLFINGTEDFNPTSTLKIEKWYNYNNTPLGSVVTGNFGNVILNSISNGLIFEWDQKNYFEQHIIMGTLVINQGWIVLDKSGAISNTFINAIQLENLNSYIDFHSGDHPGTFVVKTNEIKNTGGTINGLVNGNGDVKLEVNGNFTNLGNVCLIYNSGTANTGNGNAFLKLTGKYTQTHGDFRGIFNISSTNAGKSDIEMGETEITGGIFMANYSCHTALQTSRLKINGNLAISFSNINAKFRGNGLTSLSGILNNQKLLLTVTGNLTIHGIPGSEFISSGSTGNEMVHIAGNATFNGGSSYFNMGSHLTEIYIEKSLITAGGVVYLSKTTGTFSAVVNQNFQITSGELNIKGNSGNANLTVLGNYNQTGGTVSFHNNPTEPTSNIIYFTVHGSFTNNSGTVVFDNNSTSTVNHRFSLNGSTFTLDGTAQFISPTTKNGVIYYDYVGELLYHSHGNQFSFQNTKQVISSGCILKVSSGNMQAASLPTAVYDMIKVSDGGVLDLGNQQVYSNRDGLYSGIIVDQNAKLRISSKAGLYDGTTNASINPLGNMTYILHATSVVEYYGDEIQVITGIGTGAAQTTDQQYGLIEINKNAGKAILKASDVIIRKGLFLNKGELDLNSYNLTLISGATHAITSSLGYIRSEPENPATGGQVKWKNIEQGYHVIPFGISENNKFPVTFVPVSGTGREFIVSTRRSAKDNRPLPSGITNLNLNGTDAGNDKLIDRWFYIHAQGITANISLAYLPEENTTQPGLATGNFSIISWSNQSWNMLGGIGNGTTTQTGKVSLNNADTWGYFALASHELQQYADILEFSAQLVSKQVNLDWISKANIVADNYTIERSSDEQTYVSIIEQPAMPHSSGPQTYSVIDYNPLPGISWYRLRQNGADGSVKYSNLKQIDNSTGVDEVVEIENVGPNPFTSYFTVNFSSGTEGTVDIYLTTLTGQKIFSETIQVTQGSNKYTYHTGGRLIAGMYLLTISDGKTRATQKLFKK